MERAIFAGGCFWCMVQPFEEQDGILSVRSGYTGGHVENPTYEQVKAHETGHTEAVEIIFDEEKISYGDLVEIYWAQTDPTDAFVKKRLLKPQKQHCKLQVDSKI